MSKTTDFLEIKSLRPKERMAQVTAGFGFVYEVDIHTGALKLVNSTKQEENKII